MKKLSLVLLALSVLLIAGWSGGCDTTKPQTPPTALDLKFFDVQTNWVTQVITNVVTVNQTNTVFQTNTVTGAVTSALEVHPQQISLTITNPVPSYTFAPNANATALTATGGAIATPFGFGGIVTAVLGGIFGLWGHARSRSATNTSETLVQVIETARNIIRSSPNGDQLSSKFDQWMMNHQTDAGVIQNVAKLVDLAVDPDAAKGVAQQLVGLATAPLGGAAAAAPIGTVLTR